MIVDMKKVTVLCIDKDRDATLNKLRDLGVIHIEHIKEPHSSDLDQERNTLDEANIAIGILKQWHSDMEEDEISEGRTVSAPEAITQVHHLDTTLTNITTHHDDLHNEIIKLKQYGDCSPDTIKKLKAQGISIGFFSISEKNELPKVENAVVSLLNITSSSKIFSIISDSKTDYAGDELPGPDRKLSEVQDEFKAVTKEIEETEKKLKELVINASAIEEHMASLTNSVMYHEAREGMGESNKITYLRGYSPIDGIKDIEDSAKKMGWGLVVDDPADNDDVPTLIKYPNWVKPIKAMLDFIAITPGYKEADISSVFLLFFSVFFAMLIGDAGYGILFLCLTMFARKKMKKAPSYPFVLFYILSVCTTIWGVMTANYFGIHTEALPSQLLALKVTWLTDQQNIMKLCFLIGATHLSIAHLWNAMVLFPNKKWLAQIGWIGLVWTMFFTAGKMILNGNFPDWAIVMGILGFLAIIAFMTAAKDFKKDWIDHAMLPLSLVSCFVDVVSYIRLFAVGMASMSVAQSFNDMALGMGWEKIWTIPIIAAILLIGHGLNIALCALGVLVHGVRLNTLEFSLHKKMEWSGTPYRPFAKY